MNAPYQLTLLVGQLVLQQPGLQLLGVSDGERMLDELTSLLTLDVGEKRVRRVPVGRRAELEVHNVGRHSSTRIHRLSRSVPSADRSCSDATTMQCTSPFFASIFPPHFMSSRISVTNMWR